LIRTRPSDPAIEGPVAVVQNDKGFFAYVFSCLPHLLLKASPSKGLAEFLQNLEVPSYVQDHGHNLEAIVEAIKTYILVCLFSPYMSN